jgi:hypothetical protein
MTLHRLFCVSKDNAILWRWTQVGGGGRLMTENGGYKHLSWWQKNVDYNSLFIVWTSNHAPATHTYKIKKVYDIDRSFFLQLLQQILGMWQYFVTEATITWHREAVKRECNSGWWLVMMRQCSRAQMVMKSALKTPRCSAQTTKHERRKRGTQNVDNRALIELKS